MNHLGITRFRLFLALLCCLAPLLGCGDADDLGGIISSLGYAPTDLEIHRSSSSRAGWCRFSFSGPMTVVASSSWLGTKLDTSFVLTPKETLFDLAAMGTADAETALKFQGFLADAAHAGLAAAITPTTLIWEIAAGKEIFSLPGGSRIRVSHLLWDPAAGKILLLYSYLYG